MALADIIAKIEGDASAEAAAIIAAAEERASEILATAQSKAEAHTADVVAAAEAAAKREADTVVVNARLRARDASVSAHRDMVEEALAGAAEAITALPDDRYAAFLAESIVAAAHGGETLALGSADVGRAAQITKALARVAPDLKVAVSEAPAPFERGALLTGSRVRADLSLMALVEERRDELELVIADVLFAKEA